jgi:flagellar biosynthesis/type III secretory pathway chaperone
MNPTYAALVDRETNEWNTLLDLLRVEQAALQQGDISDLAHISNAKLDLVRSLDRLAHEREQLLTQHAPVSVGHLSDKGLLELRESARTLNQHNGALIDRRLHSVRKAVDILLGSASRHNVYDQEGQQASRQSYRPLTAA